jgi:hypothetical protein
LGSAALGGMLGFWTKGEEPYAFRPMRAPFLTPGGFGLHGTCTRRDEEPGRRIVEYVWCQGDGPNTVGVDLALTLRIRSFAYPGI